jgi:hypothetical protein
MRILIFLFLFVSVGLFTSCGDDDEMDLASAQFHFKAVYDNAPLVIGQTYTYENQLPIFFTRLKFYISDLSLINENGNAVVLSPIEGIDFTESNVTENGANSGLEFNFSEVPTGRYTGIKMGVGVSSLLNKTKPADYQSSHPLSETADYWSAWDSYIFSKVEGKADVSKNGTFELGLAYHTGSDDLYREVVINTPIEIESGQNQLKDLSIDVKKLLYRSSSDFLDVQVNSAVHTDIDLMRYMMDNYSQAISMR